MPLHRFFASPGTFSPEDKEAIAKRITSVYTQASLPAFYVVVLFIDVPKDSFFVGGELRKNFVRVVSQHLARSLERERWSGMLDTLEAAWAPFIKDRGLDWEMHIEENERDLWRIQGMAPPAKNSDGEKLWVAMNRPVPYKL